MVTSTDCSASDDADLVGLVMAGSEVAAAAEAELCRRLAPRVRLYGLRHLRDPAAAADLVQDVLLMTLQKLRARQLREPDRLGSFVLGICRQMVIDQRRSRSRRERLLATYGDELGPAAEVPDPALDSARLRDCLEGLAERQRSVVVMTFFAEQEAAAVAAELGLTPANVRVIRHRAVERLRRCMQGAGGSL